MARRSTGPRDMDVLTNLLCSFAAVNPAAPEGLEPGEHISCEVALRLRAEVQLRHAKTLDLAGLELEPRRHLVAGQNRVRRRRVRHGKHSGKAP
jgi:hypothetical protein